MKLSEQIDLVIVRGTGGDLDFWSTLAKQLEDQIEELEALNVHCKNCGDDVVDDLHEEGVVCLDCYQSVIEDHKSAEEELAKLKKPKVCYFK